MNPGFPEAWNPGEGSQAELTDQMAMPTMEARLWKARSWSGGNPISFLEVEGQSQADEHRCARKRKKVKSLSHV